MVTRFSLSALAKALEEMVAMPVRSTDVKLVFSKAWQPTLLTVNVWPMKSTVAGSVTAPS